MFSEIFRLHPTEGSFDTAQIREYLESLPYVGPDPVDSNKFVIAYDADHLEVALEARLENGHHSARVALVIVAPHEVRVWNPWDHVGIKRAQAMTQWMLDHFRCRVIDENSRDVTELANGDASKIYPEKL